jgi:hypothetical protein
LILLFEVVDSKRAYSSGTKETPASSTTCALLSQSSCAHRRPPPWALHRLPLFCALFPHPGSRQRRPPPWCTQRPLGPAEALGQSGSSQRLPPPRTILFAAPRLRQGKDYFDVIETSCEVQTKAKEKGAQVRTNRAACIDRWRLAMLCHTPGLRNGGRHRELCICPANPVQPSCNLPRCNAGRLYRSHKQCEIKQLHTVKRMQL